MAEISKFYNEKYGTGTGPLWLLVVGTWKTKFSEIGFSVNSFIRPIWKLQNFLYVKLKYRNIQCCGSKYIEFRSVSRILAQFGLISWVSEFDIFCLHFILHIFACVDPDLYSEYGSGSGSGSRKLLNTDPIRSGSTTLHRNREKYSWLLIWQKIAIIQYT